MPETTMLWNLLLSVVAGAMVWWIRGVNTRIEETRVLVSRTREDMAREYALKNDVERDLRQIMARFDRLETKLDNLLERMAK
jgi:phage shock protein A